MVAVVLTILSGAIVGFVLGLIGGGGSILAVPLLIYLVGVSDPHLALGTSAIAVAANALMSLASHAREGNVEWRPAAIFSVAGVAGAAVGSTVGKAFDGQRLLVLFGAMMLVIAARMLWAAKPAGEPRRRQDSVPRLLGIGLGVGTLSGFFGIGGGFLIVPGLLAATGMPMIRAVGTSLVSVAAFGATTAASYAASGLVSWRVVALFIVGGAAGSVLGARAAVALSTRKNALTRIFACVIAGVGLYVIFRSAGAIFGAPGV